MSFTTARRRALGLAASSIALTVATPAFANDDTSAVDIDPSVLPEVITRDDVDFNTDNPDGSLDTDGINGIGQIFIRSPGGLGVCTGSLINPRTVIFAAHCVNRAPASAYGDPNSGYRLAVAFEQNARPAVLDFFFNGTQTNEDLALYGAEYLWYDERSREFGFLEADIAMMTLDTPAFDIPTWAMLFTPLDGPEHVTISGYGGRGTSASGNLGVDFRRRSAENFVSFLGSLDDYDEGLFGVRGDLPQNLYWTSFTDPDGVYDVTQLKLDFGVFGTDDVSLPREGTTAGGDSGGPLILDEKYDRDLILGVLSGGGSIFGAAAFGDAYGSYSFYQPLHAFWQVIVENNPYVYATSKGGTGQWTDPGHWIQAMDPNYFVALDGELINRLPDAPGAEVSGDGAKYGRICGIELSFPFLSTGECVEFDQDPIVGASGDQYFVEGGPGTENFVPNNVSGDPVLRIKPRYYDVTLSQGSTTLSGADIEIDRLTLDGPAILSISEGASLTSLGDFNQISGWTNIDGTLSARETLLVTGFLTGTGTLETPFFTSVAGIVAPGGVDNIGTLTIDGNAILASGSALYIDADRSGADLLSVTGVLSLSDPDDADAPGASLVFNKPIGGKAPRFGDSFTIATADGGIEGTFGTVYSFQGVLRPELTYTDTDVIANLRAGKFVEIIGRDDATARAFGAALDTLREGSYNSLYNLYGMIDLMDPAMLTQTLNSLAPDMNTFGLQTRERQSQALFGTVTDRLSMMGSAKGGQLAVQGSMSSLAAFAGTGEVADTAGFAGLAPSTRTMNTLPEGVSGFVSGGTISNGGANGVSEIDGGRSTYFGMGLEKELAPAFTMGLAVGYADGLSQFGASTTDSRMTQVAAYGSYDLGSGAYAGFAGNMEQVQTDSSRSMLDGQVFGAQNSTRLSLVAESGVNLRVSNGFTLTPRVQVGYSHDALSGMTESGGDTALAIDDLAIERIDARFGAKFAGSETIGNGWRVTPQLSADYVRMLDGSDNGMTVRFAAASDVAIALPFAYGDTEWGEVKGGIQLERGNLSFGAGFETAVGRSDLSTDRAVANVNIRF